MGFIKLFIADKESFGWLHEASSIFVTNVFKQRCRWVKYKEVEFDRVEGMVI